MLAPCRSRLIALAWTGPARVSDKMDAQNAQFHCWPLDESLLALKVVIRSPSTSPTIPMAIEVDTPLGVVGIVHADFPYDDGGAIHTRPFSTKDEDTLL